MKFRVTPLNIVGAIALGLVVFNILSPKDTTPRHVDMSGFYLLILACLIIVTFITDLIFRAILKDLRKIWIIESVFIIFTAILIIILQKAI
ncbi:hypothetical protein [Pedobacter mucosus]|uniref:hypothetical protein n=1 Tax=Pedobacter mucosus TaxID=2895286 RepID=UPI001EE3BD4C|nr:hypothetical protein [Pedobacter mucosus]UKT64621.1 hypothetical protein LOK61_02305 [Pedobacter mucosus]